MGFAKITEKQRSEFEWTVLNGMAPANHIQAAASWLVTAAQPTKWHGQRQLRNDRWLRRWLRIPSL